MIPHVLEFQQYFSNWKTGVNVVTPGKHTKNDQCIWEMYQKMLLNMSVYQKEDSLKIQFKYFTTV